MDGAPSSKVRLTAEMSPAPPASDMSITFCPPGPTSRMSRSAGKVWVTELSRALTRTAMVASRRRQRLTDTAWPAPESGIVIAALCVDVVSAPATTVAVPSAVAKLTRDSASDGLASVTLNVKVFVPTFPSVRLTSLIENVGTGSPGTLKFSVTAPVVALFTIASTPMPRAAKPAQMSAMSAAVPPPALAAAMIESRPCSNVGLHRIELHAVGHELQDPLVADGKAQARDEARPHFEAARWPRPRRCCALQTRCAAGEDRVARERAVADVDLRRVDVGEGERVVRLPVRAKRC